MVCSVAKSLSLTMTSSANVRRVARSVWLATIARAWVALTPIASHRALYLNVFRHVHHQDAVGARVAAAHERVDQNSVAGARRGELLGDQGVDERMQQALQPASLKRIGEDAFAQGRSIQRAVILQKRRCRIGRRWLPGPAAQAQPLAATPRRNRQLRYPRRRSGRIPPSCPLPIPPVRPTT